MKWTILLIQLTIIAFLALSPWLLWAQELPAGGVIEGHVMMRGDREPVEFADVTVEGLGMETSTDEKGHFRIENVPPGEYTVTVREENIKDYTFTISVVVGEIATAKCYVHREGYLLDEIVVVGEKETGDMTRQKISKEELTGVPGANNDVIRVVENMPGVAATSVMGFGSDGLVIRGTSSGDSSYMLNGFEMPQLFHFGGFISIINSELVDDITYYPGGFGVQYGDTVGGVVEVTSRSPRTDRFGGVVDLNTYASFMMFEGPVSEKTSMAVGVRRSFIDFILPEVVPEDEAEFTLAPRS